MDSYITDLCKSHFYLFMKQLQTILLVALLAVLTSCQDHDVVAQASLSYIDSLSATDPHRAIVMLDSLQPSVQSEDSSLIIHHRLLAIKARDRAYITHTSDKEILSVIDYYQRHPNLQLLPWAYTYGGRVYRDLKNTPLAIHYLQMALDELSDGSNPELQQRVRSQLAYLFYDQYLYDECKDIRHQIIEMDSLLGNFAKVVNSYADIARCFVAESQYDSAAHYARYAHHVASQHHLVLQLPALDLLDAQVSAFRGEYEESLRLIEPYLNDTTQKQRLPYQSIAAKSYMALGRYEQAEPLCHEIIRRGTSLERRSQALRWLARISHSRGQQDVAYDYQQKALSALDSLFEHETKEKTVLVNNFYASHQQESMLRKLQQQHADTQRYLIIACALIAGLLLSAGLVWLQYKRRKAERMLSHERSISSFKSSHLCQQMYALYYSQQPMSDKLWQEVEEYVDDSFPGIIAKLRRLTNLNETEWQLSLLSRLDFRNVEIAVLMGRSQPAISLAKKRLYIKVTGHEGKAEDWDALIHSL